MSRTSPLDFSTLDRALADEAVPAGVPARRAASPVPPGPSIQSTAVMPAAPPVNSPAARAAAPSPGQAAKGAPLAWWKSTSVLIVGALLLCAVGEAVAIGILLTRRSAAAVPGIGTFSIETVPAGARVVVDGADRGASPLRLEVAPGDHLVVVTAGSQRREIPIAVAAGGTYAHHVEFAAAADAAATATGGLEIRTRPAGASVVIAGEPRGRTPLTVSNLPPGTHDVLLSLGGQQLKESVTIRSGATIQLSSAFPAAGAGRASGWIAVSSPVELTILESGQVIGTTRSPRIMIPAGRHALEFVNERLGFHASRAVDVEDGKTAAITPELPRGTVSVNASPWAEVWIDERKVGDTPLANLPLRIGVYQLTFRHPSLGERRQDVTVTADANTRVSVDMRR